MTSVDAPASDITATSNSELFARAEQRVPGGSSRTTLFVPPATPFAIEGDGAHVVDADGHTTIDCNNNYTALVHGHRPPAVLRAVDETLSWGVSFGLPTSAEVELAETLTLRLPHIEQWRFGNSGTEAVMQAIRIARAHTGRAVIVRFTGAYHGTYDAVVDPATPGIPANIRDVVIDIPYGDEQAFTDLMHERGQEVAAVLVDLMPNRAGLVPATERFAQLLRARTRACGALLIIDEVISFRLGVNGLQGRYGIEADITTLGKIIGGGFPVGAVGGAAGIMKITDPRQSGHVVWGGTFSANPISMNAGLAALRLLDAPAIAALNDKGDALRDRLNRGGLRATGAGSLLRIWPDEEPERAWWRAYRAGVQIGNGGLMALSTAMVDDDITAIGDRLLGVFR